MVAFGCGTKNVDSCLLHKSNPKGHISKSNVCFSLKVIALKELRIKMHQELDC